MVETGFRCRRCAGLWLVLAAACGGGEDGSGKERGEVARPPASLALEGEGAIGETSPASAWTERYYEGYFAETLRGDVDAARKAYRDVVASAGAAAPKLAARAALELAELEAHAGRRRQAIELVARAEALGRDDLQIRERANRLHLRLESSRSQGIEVTGPPPGTALAGVSAEAKERFERAEELLTAYHRKRLEPRLEQLRASIRAKQNAMDAAVRAYRALAELDEPLAAAAAEFRLGSLYNDLSIALMFDLPPELDATVRARLRRSLRSRAIGDLRRARDHYKRCVELARAPGVRDAGLDRWRAAAELGLSAVEDLLRGRD